MAFCSLGLYLRIQIPRFGAVNNKKEKNRARRKCIYKGKESRYTERKKKKNKNKKNTPSRGFCYLRRGAVLFFG